MSVWARVQKKMLSRGSGYFRYWKKQNRKDRINICIEFLNEGLKFFISIFDSDKPNLKNDQLRYILSYFIMENA